MTTPDPITTAREALYELRIATEEFFSLSEFIPELDATINAALDYAESLQAAKWDVRHTDTMNDMVAMGLARDSAYAEIEKLKAERDAWKETADAREALIIRRTADRDRLTSQLEQAQGSVTRLDADRNDWHDSYQKLAVRFE